MYFRIYFLTKNVKKRMSEFLKQYLKESQDKFLKDFLKKSMDYIQGIKAGELERISGEITNKYMDMNAF